MLVHVRSWINCILFEAAWNAFGADTGGLPPLSGDW